MICQLFPPLGPGNATSRVLRRRHLGWVFNHAPGFCDCFLLRISWVLSQSSDEIQDNAQRNAFADSTPLTWSPLAPSCDPSLFQLEFISSLVGSIALNWSPFISIGDPSLLPLMLAPLFHSLFKPLLSSATPHMYIWGYPYEEVLRWHLIDARTAMR